MITALLLMGLLGFVNLLIGILPVSTLSSTIGTQLTNFVQWVYQFNGIFPIDTALTLLGYAVGFWLLIGLWEFSKWVIHLIRGN